MKLYLKFYILISIVLPLSYTSFSQSETVETSSQSIQSVLLKHKWKFVLFGQETSINTYTFTAFKGEKYDGALTQFLDNNTFISYTVTPCTTGFIPKKIKGMYQFTKPDVIEITVKTTIPNKKEESYTKQNAIKTLSYSITTNNGLIVLTKVE